MPNLKYLESTKYNMIRECHGKNAAERTTHGVPGGTPLGMYSSIHCPIGRLAEAVCETVLCASVEPTSRDGRRMTRWLTQLPLCFGNAGGSIALDVDVSDKSQVRDSIEETITRFGKIDGVRFSISIAVSKQVDKCGAATSCMAFVILLRIEYAFLARHVERLR